MNEEQKILFVIVIHIKNRDGVEISKISISNAEMSKIFNAQKTGCKKIYLAKIFELSIILKILQI